MTIKKTVLMIYQYRVYLLTIRCLIHDNKLTQRVFRTQPLT